MILATVNHGLAQRKQSMPDDVHSTSIEQNPVFVDMANDDVTLSLLSLCRLAGITKYMDDDFEGKPVGDNPDMGCLEHRSLASGNPSWS